MLRAIFSGTIGLLCSAAAAAAGATVISGDVTAGYTHLQQGGANSNAYSGGASALITLDTPGFNVQVSGGDVSYSGGGSNNVWYAGLDGFWRDRKGIIGGSVAHMSAGNDLWSGDVTAYGVFGEWYVTRSLSLHWKGGGFGGDSTGIYGGAGGEYYLFQNFGIFGDYTCLRTSHVTYNQFIGGAEYQFSEDIPISLRAGGEYTTGGASHLKGFFVGVRWRVGLSGTLSELDRIGTTVWNGLP